MFDERPEITQQGFLPESRPQQQIPYFFSRYILTGGWQFVINGKGRSSLIVQLPDGRLDRAMSRVIHYVLREVERNRYIRLFHNSIFYVAKLLDIELFTVMKIIAEQRIKPRMPVT